LRHSMLCKNSLHHPMTLGKKTWASEAADRVAAYERKEIEAEDFDLVMERLRKEFLSA